MKKHTMTTLLFLFLVFGCFAETGYNGVEWDAERDFIEFPKNAETWKADELEVVSFPDLIIGRDSIKSYVFYKQKLEAVTYYFLTKDADELISRFENKKKVLEKKVVFDLQNDIEASLKYCDVNMPEYAKESEDGLAAFELVMAETMVWELVKSIETEGYKNIDESKTSKTRLLIFDYNADTRVYIFTGGFYNAGFVAYVSHIQDY